MEGPLSSSQRPGFLSGWLTDRKVVGGADTTSIQMPGGTMREQLGELGVQLASGGAASAIAKTTIAPFERTKILLQTSSLVEGVGGHRPYRGVVDALARIPREQGVTAFWRGNLTNISRVVPTYALRFMFFDQFRKLTSIGHDVSQPLPLSRQMAAGALSGSVTMLCTFPLDLLRTRMSAEVTAADAPRVYRGMYSSARRIVQTQGPSGLYQGIGISLFDVDLGTRGQARIDGGGRRSDVEGDARLFCRKGVSDRADLVGGVAVGRDAVGADDVCIERTGQDR